MLIDLASGHDILSFLDGYSGYNQIYIAEDDVLKTTFRCPVAIGTYEWVVMPFGLKNARATYQRAMHAILHEYVGKFMEVYIDDVVIKFDTEKIHVDNLKLAFKKKCRHNLKMSPLKCAFGVSAGIFLGFLIHKKGIEVDKNKAKAIMEAKSPLNKKSCISSWARSIT